MYFNMNRTGNKQGWTTIKCTGCGRIKTHMNPKLAEEETSNGHCPHCSGKWKVVAGPLVKKWRG